MSPRRWSLLGLVLLAGCAGGGSTDGSSGGPPAATNPAGDCDLGSMKVYGEDACTTIGWTDCGDGFEKDPSGWGCREVLPDAACTGASREALGSKTCVPIGDCSAAFPPANATLFVSASGPTDAKHFRSIEAAAMASRTGDVIAIDAGTYHESVQLDRAVTLVGRCAEKVVLDGTSLPDPGLIVDASVTASGLTIRGFAVGIQLAAGIDLEDSVLDANTDAAIYAEGASIHAKVARSAIRATAPADLDSGFGIDLAQGTTIDVTDTAIVDNQGAGILVAPGTTANVATSVLARNTADRNGVGGYGINGQGGNATVTRSALVGNHDTGLRAYKNGVFTVDHTVVRGTKAGNKQRGYGLVASEGGTLTASSVVVAETEGVGIAVEGATATITDAVVRAQEESLDHDFGDGAYVFNAGKLSLTRVALLENGRAGIDIFDQGTEAALDHVLVGRTKGLAGGDMGLGVAIGFGAHAAIDSTIIASNHHTGIYAFDGGTLDLTKSAVRDTTPRLVDAPLGHGVLVTDSKHVVITDSEIRRSAAVGVALANSPAVVARSVIADNAVGIHVQDGSTLNQVETPPDEPTGLDVDVTSDTKFEGNATRVGSGTIPLPEPLAKP